MFFQCCKPPRPSAIRHKETFALDIGFPKDHGKWLSNDIYLQQVFLILIYFPIFACYNKQRQLMSDCRIALYILLLTIFAGCGNKGQKEEDNGNQSIEDIWLVTEVEDPTGEKHALPNNDNMTNMYIFAGDSTMYICVVQVKEDAITIKPQTLCKYSTIYTGGGKYLLYMDGYKCPLKATSDSTIALQRYGVTTTMKRVSGFLKTQSSEITDVVRNHFLINVNTDNMYVFSAKEQILKKSNHTLTFLIIGLFLVLTAIVVYALRTYRRNKLISQQLRQISKERSLRPAKMEKAMKEIEYDFFQSDYYINIRKDIASGKILSDEEWKEMERQVNSVYPNFTHNLFGLIKMSDVEYKVCLLLKIRMTPKDIAATLCKEPSSISTVRSRLYMKIFKKKGSSTDWDNFIYTL